MTDDPLPRVLCSRCFLEPCRYDGRMVRSEQVMRILERSAVVSECPEAGMGLGIPRDPIRIVSSGGRRRLVQPATGRDLTEEMGSYLRRLADDLGGLDGIVLKSASPTCGIDDAKVFSGPKEERPFGKGKGFLAEELMRRDPDIPMIDENGLMDESKNEAFVSRVRTRNRSRLG